MRGKECVAMILAGGQGSRLGVLTDTLAKPAVPFGGKYRLIDFSLSNCYNSGIDTVGVLTQYQPLELHSYIGIGSPWDLDRNDGRSLYFTSVRPDQGRRVVQGHGKRHPPERLVSLISTPRSMSWFCPATTFIKWIIR